MVVSWGAVVGRTSPLQLLVMSCLEIACYVVNEYVSLEIFQVGLHIKSLAVVGTLVELKGVNKNTIIIKHMHTF